jgi:hypothetical protein
MHKMDIDILYFLPFLRYLLNPSLHCVDEKQQVWIPFDVLFEQ